MFLILLIASAFAADPVVAASPSVEVREAYLVSLNAQRESLYEGYPGDLCKTAKGSFLAAQVEVVRIDAELAMPANPDLGKAQADYRAKLAALKAVQAKAMESAKAVAKTAGVQLTADEAKDKALSAEISRIETEIRREKAALAAKLEAARATGLGSGGTADGLGGLGSRGRGLSYGDNDLGGLVGYSHYTDSAPTATPPLPVEFKACFPDEVGTSS